MGVLQREVRYSENKSPHMNILKFVFPLPCNPRSNNTVKVITRNVLRANGIYSSRMRIHTVQMCSVQGFVAQRLCGDVHCWLRLRPYYDLSNPRAMCFAYFVLLDICV